MKKVLFLFCGVALVFAVTVTAQATLILEGFESGVPGPGWSLLQTNTLKTWEELTAGDPHSGSKAAQVLYDPYLNQQDEWLLSPVIYPASDFTVEAWSFGSLYWGRDDLDNYDLKLWLVYGGSVGGGDDVLVGKLDDDWTGEWVWSTSFFDLDSLGSYTPGSPVQVGFQYVGVDGAQAALDDITIDYSRAAGPVPEPATVLLLGTGLVGLAGFRKKFKK